LYVDLSRFVPQISWRWKVIIPLIGATSLGIFLLTFDTLLLQRRQLEQNLQREGESYAEMARIAVNPLIGYASAERLHEELSALTSAMDGKILLLDADGMVIHSSTMEDEGRQVRPELLAVAHEAQQRSLAAQRLGRYLLVGVAPLGNPALGHVLAVQLDQSAALDALEITQRHIIAVAGTWMVLVSLVMLAVLRVLVHQPVLELRHKISRARRGDWRVSVGFAERKDEIGELGTDFNDMVRQLRENCQQCEHLHNVHLQQAAHLASIGELAAGLAHEIKNPLTGIAGAIDIIREELPPNDANRAVLGEVQNECRRIKKTISDLLSYATPQLPQLKMTDLNATLEHAIQMVEHQPEGKNIRIVRQFDPGLPPLPHDPEQLRQVLRNLLLNSIDAISGEGEIRIATRLVSPQSSRTPPSVEVVVSDTGAGMAPEQLARIFKPFFTTKHSGSGLGLAVSKRVIDQHGGSIHAESEPGRGSRLTIRLPVVALQEKAFTMV
jgi:signal transduction histidine kinase